MWKRDVLRTDDFFKMKDMVHRLRKSRKNEAANAGGGSTVTQK
jgi:hypothetical protein